MQEIRIDAVPDEVMVHADQMIFTHDGECLCGWDHYKSLELWVAEQMNVDPLDLERVRAHPHAPNVLLADCFTLDAEPVEPEPAPVPKTYPAHNFKRGDTVRILKGIRTGALAIYQRDDEPGKVSVNWREPDGRALGQIYKVEQLEKA